MRTFVYVDGFNLYYGCLYGTPHKWLDIAAMCEKLLPPNEIRAIKYFTARVAARPGDARQRSSQLPNPVPDSQRTIREPGTW